MLVGNLGLDDEWVKVPAIPERLKIIYDKELPSMKIVFFPNLKFIVT